MHSTHTTYPKHAATYRFNTRLQYVQELAIASRSTSCLSEFSGVPRLGLVMSDLGFFFAFFACLFSHWHALRVCSRWFGWVVATEPLFHLSSAGII